MKMPTRAAEAVALAFSAWAVYVFVKVAQYVDAWPF
jgi:hypothetical protein